MPNRRSPMEFSVEGEVQIAFYKFKVQILKPSSPRASMQSTCSLSYEQPCKVTEIQWKETCQMRCAELLKTERSKEEALTLYIGQCSRYALMVLYGERIQPFPSEMQANIQNLANMAIDLGRIKPPQMKIQEQSTVRKEYVVKQNPLKPSLQIIPIAQHCLQENSQIYDDIEFQKALEITTLNPNFKLSRQIAMSPHDNYRVGGLAFEGQDPMTKEKTLHFDGHIWKFDISTKDFKKISDLPMCVYDEQNQRRRMPTANQSLLKVENLGFLIIGGSWRANPDSQAQFSRDVFFYSLGSESLKLVAQLHQPKDTVTAVILHSSLYVLGGRVFSSRQVRGEEQMSKLIERIDLTKLTESGISINFSEYFEHQHYLESSEFLLNCEIVQLAQDIEVPAVPMLCSAISDERTNSIEIAGGRLLNKMSNRAYRYYFSETVNSNYIRMIEQDQDLADACCFIDSSVMFRRSEGRKVVCHIGISRELHVLILTMRTTEGIEIEKHISYYHKLNKKGGRNTAPQNSRVSSNRSAGMP